VPNFVKIGQSVANILFFFLDFSRWRHIWTNNSEYLGVSITLQNLVMIDTVVFEHLIICGIHAPKIGVLGQFDPLNGL